MEALLIDEQGYLIDKIVIDESELPKENVITEPYDYRFHKPKWNSEEWVEGVTAEEKAEREAAQQLEAFLPSSEEIADAELEIKMITLLTEMGVIEHE